MWRRGGRNPHFTSHLGALKQRTEHAPNLYVSRFSELLTLCKRVFCMIVQRKKYLPIYMYYYFSKQECNERAEQKFRKPENPEK